MAGKNIVLKEGQRLFRQGEKADGMYIVRRGDLQVYLEESTGRELALATVSAGGMIGEMSLFDNAPRSASAKATTDCEITFISLTDFKNLTKQIPRWFTTLMGTISSRLRATNDRLQNLEGRSEVMASNVISVQRILTVLNMLWYRDGEKDGKEWTLEIAPVKSFLSIDFCEGEMIVDKVVDALISHTFYSKRRNANGVDVFVSQGRGGLARLTHFLKEYTKHGPTAPLSKPAIDMLYILKTHAAESAYEVLSLAFSALFKLGEQAKVTTLAAWEKALPELSRVGEELKIGPGENREVSFRTRKAEIQDIYAAHSLLSAICAEIL